jgi:hypothetical protein
VAFEEESMKRAWFAMAVAITLLASPAAFAQTAPAAPTTPARPKFVTPIKGVAEVGFLKPTVKVEGGMVVTTLRVKNLSAGAIARLRVDDFWYDKAGTLLPGDSQFLKQPLLPGEVATITLKTPKNPKMDRNSYQFSHANGQVKAKLLTKLE